MYKYYQHVNSVHDMSETSCSESGMFAIIYNSLVSLYIKAKVQIW